MPFKKVRFPDSRGRYIEDQVDTLSRASHYIIEWQKAEAAKDR